MNILFLGDIVGRSGRTALANRLPKLRQDWKIDFVIANAENATGGAGLSIDHAKLIFSSGVDCITLGDHAFDQREMIAFSEQEHRIIRPLNFATVAPGHGRRVFNTGSGKRILVIQVLGQVFMKKNFSDPFLSVKNALKSVSLGSGLDAIVLDVHAEATSEKMALGHWCDGKVTLVVGTHTHIPTADLQILKNGTAFQSDAGMCGDYDSVIGMDKLEPISRFITGMSRGRFVPATGDATICGVLVEVSKSGQVSRAESIRHGGKLEQSLPNWFA